MDKAVRNIGSGLGSRARGVFGAILAVSVSAAAVFLACSDKEKSPAGPDSKETALTAYEYFTELSRIPRCSGNERAINEYLAEFGRKHGLETSPADAKLNLLIKKGGSVGRENEPAVVLQAHIDMVCVKNDGVNHDFTKDPIIPLISGDGWVTASKQTTLGADDGIGVAYIMAILAAKNLSHPPIEALFTTGEEVGMTGAANFNPALLSGTRFINLDSEWEGILLVSGAAGARVNISVPVAYETPASSLSAYTLTVKGLAGGHSGVDINKGFANANLLTAEILDSIKTDIRVSEINGGEKANAIPFLNTALLLFDESGVSGIQSAIARREAAFRAKYPAETNLSVTLEKNGATPNRVMNTQSLNNVLEIIAQTPNGVIAMDPYLDGLVQTSNNLGMVVTNGETVTLSSFARSSRADEQAATIDSLKSLADKYGAPSEVKDSSPPWSYNPNSQLRVSMVETFTAMYGYEPRVEGVHGGLECGLFFDKRPDIDYISIGPDIEYPHSYNERMRKASAESVFAYLVKVLENL